MEDVIPEIYCRVVTFPAVVGRVLQEFQKRNWIPAGVYPRESWYRQLRPLFLAYFCFPKITKPL